MDAGKPAAEQPASWTFRVRQAIDRQLPMDHLLPTRQPYYVGSWSMSSVLSRLPPWSG